MEQQEQKQIVEKIEEIRKKFRTETVDEKETSVIFLDHIDGLIKKIFKDNDITVYDVFDKDFLEKWKNRSVWKKIKNLVVSNGKSLFYFIFLTFITGFLVSEALLFYADEGVVNTKTIIKAILTEIAFVFLSGYRAIGKIETTAVSLLRVGVFSLMLFVITSKTFIDSSVFSGNADSVAVQVSILEKQIEEKERKINYYLEKNWPITVKQLSQEKDVLVNKILELKEKQAQGVTQNTSVLVKYKAYGNAFFRILLLFISVLITRRMFKF
jgi:hypothetical protein